LYASVFKGWFQAAVAFYGTPPSPIPPAETVKAAMLGIFSENDHNQATRIAELTDTLVAARAQFDIEVCNRRAEN